MKGEYRLNNPDYLTRIHLKGAVPIIFENLFKHCPTRELSGDFFASIGFNKPGKELNIQGKKVQVLLINCQKCNCQDDYSDSTVVFVKLNDRGSFKKLNSYFNLTQKVNDNYRHQRTIIGLLEEPVQVSQAERDELSTNRNIEYHEISVNEIEDLEKILIDIIEKSLLLPQYLLKIACLGSEKKTSIIHNYVKDNLTADYLPTLGVDITNKRLNVHGVRVDLIIVDTAEQKDFGKLRPNYYRGANGGLIFFDFEREKSFNAIRGWINEFSTYIKDPIPIALIGIEGERQRVPVNEAKALAQEYNMEFYKIQKNKPKLNEIAKKITEIILTN